MQNVTIAGANYSDVPSVELNKTGGGTALFVDVSDTDTAAGDVFSGKKFYTANGNPATGSFVWNWMGVTPEYLGNVYDNEVALSATNYATWTPSTTAKAIRATSSLTARSMDFGNYEYYIRWRFYTEVVYNSGATNVARTLLECSEAYQVLFKRPSTFVNIQDNNFNGNACVTLYTAPFMRYYNADGNLTYTWANTYGLYMAMSAATFGSSTNNVTNVTIKIPTLNARCSATYFSTSNARAVDQTNTKLKTKGDLFRVNRGGVIREMYGDLVGMINNGI